MQKYRTGAADSHETRPVHHISLPRDERLEQNRILGRIVFQIRILMIRLLPSLPDPRPIGAFPQVVRLQRTRMAGCSL